MPESESEPVPESENEEAPTTALATSQGGGKAGQTRRKRGFVRRLLKGLNPRYSVKAQMYLGLGVALGLATLGSVVAINLLGRISGTQEEIALEVLPDMQNSFQVSRLGVVLAAAAPRLIAAASEAEHADITLEIEQVKQEFIVVLDSLVDMGNPVLYQESASSVRALGERMIDNLDRLDASVRQSFVIQSDMRRLEQQLPSTQDEGLGILLPALDDTLFFLATGYSSLEQPPQYITDFERQRLLLEYKRYLTLQAQINLAVSILGGIPGIVQTERIISERDRFLSAAETMERSLENLREGDLRRRLTDILDYLQNTIGQGNQGMFAIRQAQIAHLDSQAQLLLENREIATELAGEVDRLVANVRAAAAIAAEGALQEVSSGRTLLIGLNLGAVLAVLLLGWLVVERALLRRITHLSARMRRMAQGELQIPVYVKGHDEVANMAQALDVFRDYAQKAQRLDLIEQLSNEVQEKNKRLEGALEKLRDAQSQIVTREKLAALGELSAGIAHELKNPLNFVNNFADLSRELLEELREALEEASESLEEENRTDIEEVIGDLHANLEKISSHGQRADRIIRSMLMHGRSSGEVQMTDINNLVSDYADLAYHSNRAADPDFNVTIHKDLAPDLELIEVSAQEISRAFLNLVGNACDAVTARLRGAGGAEGDSSGAKDSGDDYEPMIWLTTAKRDNAVEIRVRDNGTGMPQEVIEKIFHPFFTTKAAGSGTGLGLSMTHDIIVEHGGDIQVESEEGKFTEITVTLPYQRAGSAGDGDSHAAGDAHKADG